jgi:DNA-binding SARP family transcriptional activator
MEFRVLGPLQVARAGIPVYVGEARKVRLVLAVLLAEAGRPVEVDQLVEAVWDGHPPPSARRNIHQYVHRLRGVLGADVLLSRPGGYLLAAGDHVDAVKFRAHATKGAAAAASGDLEVALRDLQVALDMWRGPAYDGFLGCESVAAEARRLEQLRLDAVVTWARAMLTLGRHAEVAGRLSDFVRADPYREDLIGCLLLALYGCGRQNEALDLFRRTYALFRDELGVGPGEPLQRLHLAILRGDPLETVAISPFGRCSGPPRELPKDVESFTGREAALAALEALLPDMAGNAPGNAVATIVGTAGVGKTALAVHWAHRVARWFPDGQLYINLEGYGSARPMASMDALTRLMRSLGVAPDQMPIDLAEAAARYRSLTADRRLLIVLDNAASADQLRPLLPAGHGCAVVVTCRDRLTGLVARDGVVRVILDVLTPTEANLLLCRRLGVDRVRAEAGASRQLAELCSRLPLALCIVSANLADQPYRGIAEQVARLRADPMAELAVDGDADGSAIRRVFESSYHNLPESTRRLFRRLGLVACQDFTAGPAAALADVGECEAAAELDRLAANHLVDQHRPGRYTLHDLLRCYAANVAQTEESAAQRAAAVRRLTDHYLAGVTAAGQLTHPHLIRVGPRVAPVRPRGVDDHASAQRWFDAERANLLVVLRHAARKGPADTAWQLADELRAYYDMNRHMVDWLDAARSGLTAARATGSVQAQVAAFHGLAHVNFWLGRYHRAIAYQNRTIALDQDADSQVHQVFLTNLAILLAHVGRTDEALGHLTRAVDSHERTGYQIGLSLALLSLANLHLQCGQLRAGVDVARRTLNLTRELNSWRRRASSLNTLADLHHQLGRFSQAERYLAAALSVYRRFGVRDGEADAMRTLAAVLCDSGRPVEAKPHAERAISLAQDVHARLVESAATTVLATACRKTGDLQGATDLHHRAVEIAEKVQAPYHIADALIGLANTRHCAGDHQLALRDASAALERARAARYRVLEGRALTVLASIRLTLDQTTLAQWLGREAVRVHQHTGHWPGEAIARAVVARSTAEPAGPARLVHALTSGGHRYR